MAVIVASLENQLLQNKMIKISSPFAAKLTFLISISEYNGRVLFDCGISNAA